VCFAHQSDCCVDCVYHFIFPKVVMVVVKLA